MDTNKFDDQSFVKYFQECKTFFEKHDHDLVELLKKDSSVHDLLSVSTTENQQNQLTSSNLPSNDIVCNAIQLHLGQVNVFLFCYGEYFLILYYK